MNLASLTRLRRYEDPATGIWEEFATRRLGPADAFALRSGGLGEPRGRGWVVCPAVGPEHGNVRRAEAVLARRLAMDGFTAVRIRPDVDAGRGARREIDYSARLGEAEEAVQALLDEPGIEDVGAIGTLLGAAVAASVCRRLALPALALIEPVLDGRRYVRDMLRREQVADLMATAETPAATPASVNDRLAADGHVTIRGLRLSRAELERVEGVEGLAELDAFAGRALVVGVSPGGRVPAPLRRLRERLEAQGCDVTLELVDHELETPFGDYYYRNVGLVRIDTRLEVDRAIAGATAAWALEAQPAAPGREPA